jgi:hypothetical protein
MNFFTRAGKAVIAVLLGPCYSGRFVYEDAYQDDEYDYCCFYTKEPEDYLDSILSEEFVF